MDFGPDWLWNAGCVFAVLGVIATASVIGFCVYWLITHVSIVLN